MVVKTERAVSCLFRNECMNVKRWVTLSKVGPSGPAWSQLSHIAVFPILADAVDVKRGDQLCETVSQPSIQPDKVVRPMGSWPRPCLDFDHIGQNWEDSNMSRDNGMGRQSPENGGQRRLGDRGGQAPVGSQRPSGEPCKWPDLVAPSEPTCTGDQVFELRSVANNGVFPTSVLFCDCVPSQQLRAPSRQSSFSRYRLS